MQTPAMAVGLVEALYAVYILTYQGLENGGNCKAVVFLRPGSIHQASQFPKRKGSPRDKLFGKGVGDSSSGF